MKDKMNDFRKIRNFEEIMRRGKHIDQETENLKNTLDEFKKGLKKAKNERNKSTMDSYYDEQNYRSSKNPSPNRK
jgi:hypothetical protein